MNDRELRELYGRYPTPEFSQQAFNPAPIIAQASVAIVTTAGLMVPGEPWDDAPVSFRSFPRGQRGLIVGHPSAGFDRSGGAADINVIYPADRLEELATEGFIKAAAPRHVSFMGGIGDLSSVLVDSGPAAAKLLRDDGVDVVVILPVCPLCPRTANALAHVMEQAGLCTVVFASNLAFAERMRPPRALYCDFPIGRPLGVPRDAEFQRRVLRAGIDLLRRPAGPVLEVFPDRVSGEAEPAMTCTIPPSHDPSLAPAVAEARAIMPAWRRTHAANGATQVGRSITGDEVPAAMARFIRLAEGDRWQEADFSTERDISNQAMDIRIFYEEASISLADHVPAARAGDEWFYGSTLAGRLMADVFARLRSDRVDLSPEVFLTLLPMHRPEFAHRFRLDWDELLQRAAMDPVMNEHEVSDELLNII